MKASAPHKVTLALIAAAAPILSGVAAVYHERNVAAAVQAKRDEALLKALTACMELQRELHAPAPAPSPTPAPPAPAEYGPAPPPPPPTAEIHPRLDLKVLREPTATEQLDALAKNYGWKK